MARKSKVGVIGLKGLPAFGGAANVGQEIANHLCNDIDFTIYLVETHTSALFQSERFKVVVFKRSYIKKLNVFFYYLKSAFHALIFRKFDVIHLHHVDGAFVLPLLRLRYRVVVTSHGQPYLLSKWSSGVKLFFRINEQIAVFFASQFTVVGKPLLNYFESKYKREFIYIPNGINIVQNQTFSLSNSVDQPYWLFAAGRIVPEKGLHFLLEALKSVKNRPQLIVVGDLAQMPSYQNKIERLSQTVGNVKFFGLIKDKNQLNNIIRKANLFIFPSLIEAMSMMLLEVVALKTPILCSNIDANLALFNNSEMFYFDINNKEDLIQKLNDVVLMNVSLDEYVSFSFARLTTDYQWDTISLRYRILYEDGKV